MAEEIEVNYDAPIIWKKTGGGSFRLKGKIIKPGQRFQAKPSEIPPAFRDVIIPLSKIVEVPIAEAPISTGKKPVYTSQPSEKREMKHRGESRLLWDVFDIKDGKMINEKALVKAEAQELIGYDIINPNGKVMNEVSLTREQTERAIKNLNS